MANEDAILREVDQDLAEERQWAMFRRYGPAAIGAAAAVLVAVGGYQWWQLNQRRAAEAEALELRSAIELFETDEAGAHAALAALGEKDDGYGVLADLLNAAAYARDGERAAALEQYRAVYDGAAPKRLKEFARIRAAYLALADGRDAVLADLGTLADEDGPFRAHAQEVAGVAALRDRDFETALAIFRQLAIDLSAPQALRTRADEFGALASAGRTGANVFGEAQLDDIIGAVGASEAEEAPNAAEDLVSDVDAGAISANDEQADDSAEAEPAEDLAPSVQEEQE